MTTCKEDGCTRIAAVTGQCRKHYEWAYYRRRRIAAGHAPPAPRVVTCGACGKSFERVERQRLYCSPTCARLAASIRSHQRDYGLSKTDFRELMERQGGVCAICRQPERARGKRVLSVDHDHVSGRVRGLLCHHCNAAIGHFADDPARLRAAADYLERTSAHQAA